MKKFLPQNGACRPRCVRPPNGGWGGFHAKKGFFEPKLEVFGTQRGVPCLRRHFCLQNEPFTPQKGYLYPKLRFFFFKPLNIL